MKITLNNHSESKYKIFYNLSQKKVTDVSGPHNSKLNMENAASYLDDYYVNGICKKWGIGELIAAFELVPATLLVKFINSPATKTNWLTSFGELLQVLLSRSKRFGDPKIDKNEFKKLSCEEQSKTLETAKQAKERREGIMALIQVGAGLSGLGSLGVDALSAEKEPPEISKANRTTLSLSSLASAILMLSGFFEKNLIAGIAGKLPGTTENNMMSMNGNSDARCFVEWVTMAVLPWIPKKVKTVIDIAIPLLALKEGASQLVQLGHIPTIITKKVLPLPLKLISFLKKIPFLVDKEEGSNVPKFAGTNFFLEKIRKSLFLPALRFFKTNPPECYLQGENLVCEFAKKEEPAIEKVKNTNHKIIPFPQQVNGVSKKEQVLPAYTVMH